MKTARSLILAAVVTGLGIPVTDAEAGRIRAITSFGARVFGRAPARAVIPRARNVRPWVQRKQRFFKGGVVKRQFAKRTGRATGLRQLKRQRQDARIIKKGLRLGKRGLRQHFDDAQKPESERYWKKRNGVYFNNSDRKVGVDRAWAQERALVKQYGRGTRKWTDAEKAELRKRGKVTGYEGHHRTPVVGSTVNGRNGKLATGNPALSRDPDNIVFLKKNKHGRLHEMMASKNVTGGKLTPRDVLAKVYEIERQEASSPVRSAARIARARQIYRNIAAERLRQANRLRAGGLP